MKVCLEALLELCFCIKPLNFRVEAHMEAPVGVALRHKHIDREMESRTSRRARNIYCL
jgi:hypothetical protein